MGQIHVFNKLKWKPPIATKLLKTPELELNLSYPDDDIKTMPGKQKDVFDKTFKSSFDSKFQALSSAKIKEVQDAVKWTEDKIPDKKTEKEKEEVVDTANKLLKQAFTVWQQQVEKLCDDCVQKAFEESIKVMKMKLVKAKLKSICKIVVISLLILTAAGLAIAATVVTGRALAPIVIGAIVTGLGALYKVYQQVDKGWATSSNKIKEIKADIAKLEKAKAVYDKAQKDYAGKVDKLKAFFVKAMAPIQDLHKHVGQLDKFIFEIKAGLKKQDAELKELTAKAKDAKDVLSEIGKCNAEMHKANDALDAIEAVTKAAGVAKTDYDQMKSPDLGPLNGAVSKLEGAGSYIKTLGTVVKGLSKVVKVLQAA